MSRDVYEEIKEERVRQIRVRGDDPDNVFDAHGLWAVLADLAYQNFCRFNPIRIETGTIERAFRQLLIESAAVIVATIEALDSETSAGLKEDELI